MENLFYDLSEEEFSRERKILLWVFVALFFAGGIYVAMLSPVFGVHHIKPVLSLAPFGISIIVGIIALLATVKRKGMYFVVDDEKIEFNFGFIKPQKSTYMWIDLKELVFPHKEKKIKIIKTDGSSSVINLNWIQRKKSSIIKRHIYYTARHKELNIIKVKNL